MTDIELAKTTIPEGADEDEEAPVLFLQVIDAPFDGDKPKVHTAITNLDDVYDEIKGLQNSHEPGYARILDVTIHSNFLITGLRDTKGPKKTQKARESLMRLLKAEYTQRFDPRRIFRWHDDPLLVNDIGSIARQWSQHLGDGDTHFYRLVNRSSLQQDPLDFDLHPRDSYLTCAQDDKDRLIVILVHDVWTTQKFRLNTASKGDRFQNPRSISKIADGTSWTSVLRQPAKPKNAVGLPEPVKPERSLLTTFVQLLILDFFEASIYLQPVDYYEKLIYPRVPEEDAKEVLNVSLTKNPHLQVPLGLFEPRLSSKSREAFKEIEDAEGILRSVNNLVDSITYVLEVVKLNDKLGHCADRIKWLEKLCEERRENAQRALEALGRQLDYLSKRHAIREAKSIKILTILASVYLPLSLSASLLGMQSPFKLIAHDRTLNEDDDDNTRLVGTNLLFDFFGVFIILAASTIFILYSIRLGLYVHGKGITILPRYFKGPFSILDYGKRWRFGGRGGDCFEKLHLLAVWFVGAGALIVLLVVFLKGMLTGSQSAWDYAKWGFTAFAAIGGILVSLYVGLYVALYHKKLKVGWRVALRHSVIQPTSEAR